MIWRHLVVIFFEKYRYFRVLLICLVAKWSEMAGIIVKWAKMTDLHHKYGFWEKNFKMFCDFGGGHGHSNRFFERFPIFDDLIELAKGFNLRHMRVLGSLRVKRYYVITKKLRQNRKFRSKKYFFLDFGNMFWDYFLKFFNIQWRFPGY